MPWKSTLPIIENADPSRNVPESVSEDQIREEIPFNWKEDQTLWGYVNKYKIGGSGVGFITPPYMAFWERVWGATPIEDLPKYKDLYAFIPYITKSVDVTVNMAASNGFELEGGEDTVREWLQDWIDQHNLLQTIRIAATDMLVYGNAFLEVCRDEASGEIVWLKPLDPVHMRVRRDQFGNVFGYIQMLTFPPWRLNSLEKNEEFDREGFERLQQQAEEYRAKLRERMGKFNINDVLRQAKDLRSTFVDGLGEVGYVLLTEGDICDLAKKYPEDPRERNIQALFRMMSLVDSEVTVEKLRMLPYDVSRRLQETLLNTSFLPVKKMSQNGSTAPANFKAQS